MGRVSLTEAYDDRSVIAKLNEMDKRVKENAVVVTSAEASAKASAQAAQETADRFAGSVGAVVQNANQQINASKAQVDQAKAEVDATVTTVAQAVQTANNASASAQQSATTVEGYDTRLTAVEDADTHNVKLEGNQSITGIKTVPTEATGSLSQQIANSDKIGAELDNYAPMVRTTGNQTIYGEMTINRMICGNLIPNKKQTAPYGYGTNGENWHKTYTGKLASYSRGGTLIVYDVINGNFGVFVILGYSGLIRADRVIGDFPLERIKLCKGTAESDTDFAIYFNTSAQNNRLWVYVDSDFSSLNANTPYPSTSIFTPLVPTIPENDPSTTGVWTTVVTGVE